MNKKICIIILLLICFFGYAFNFSEQVILYKDSIRDVDIEHIIRNQKRTIGSFDFEMLCIDIANFIAKYTKTSLSPINIVDIDKSSDLVSVDMLASGVDDKFRHWEILYSINKDENMYLYCILHDQYKKSPRVYIQYMFTPNKLK